MIIAQKYTPTDGSLTEQFNNATGSPLSAVDLTWSYAALLTANARRNDQLPAAWLIPGSSKLPSQCGPSGAVGTYSSVTATSFPTGTATTSTSATTTVSACPTKVAVTFDELATTYYGENIFITGSSAELGSWSTDSTARIALSASNYTIANPLWYTVITLPSATSVEYKYYRVGSDGQISWESDPNRIYNVPNCQASDTVHGSWR